VFIDPLEICHPEREATKVLLYARMERGVVALHWEERGSLYIGGVRGGRLP
jgi:hypothetical protein